MNIDLIGIVNSLDFTHSTTDANKKSNLEQENFGGSVQWRANWTQKQATDFEGYFSSYQLNSVNQTLEGNQVLHQKNKVLDTGFRIRNSSIISKIFTLNTGYQFNETGVTNFDEINIPLFSRTITNVLRSHALIAEGLYEANDKTTLLKVGLRANYFDKFKIFLLEPRIQFNHAFTPNFRMEILGEKKNQTLSQIIDLQQDFLGIEKRRWVLTDNDSIPIQKSFQLSMGLTFSKNKWLFTIDNFYKKVSGITAEGQGFMNQFELAKATGNYTVIGTELLIQKTYRRFYTWLSYSFNDNLYDFETLHPTSFSSNYQITHAVSWAGIYEWEKVKLALGAKWHSGRPITTPASLTVNETNPQIVYNAPNNSRLNDYIQVNFSASKDWKLNSSVNLQATASILNLLNTKNSLNRFYRINNTNNTVESVTLYGLELTPNLNLKLSF